MRFSGTIYDNHHNEKGDVVGISKGITSLADVISSDREFLVNLLNEVGSDAAIVDCETPGYYGTVIGGRSAEKFLKIYPLFTLDNMRIF
ncbi:MAG: hypothetical protein GY804_11690 [Alphaproteobacteria bacterium]|nr:hypothetical protein [Alphaproteobacteria bacterium]